MKNSCQTISRKEIKQFRLNSLSSYLTKSDNVTGDVGLRENGSRFSPKICVPIETPRREDGEFQFSRGKSATLSVRQRSCAYILAIYTNSELARALWNEDSYSPDTGVTGKLRDRGRFFITTQALSPGIITRQVLHGIRSATLKSFGRGGGSVWSRDEMVALELSDAGNKAGMKEIMGRTFIAPGV